MIRTKFTHKENVDSGLGLLLILIILGLYYKENFFFKAAIPVALLTMTVPTVIYPFTICWLNISDLLGRVMSKVIISAIFFIIVLPVAIYRNLRGKDSLLLNKYKKSTGSIFIERNHTYSKSDIINPF